MDPKREAQLKLAAEAVAFHAFGFLSAMDAAAQGFERGIALVEKGNAVQRTCRDCKASFQPCGVSKEVARLHSQRPAPPNCLQPTARCPSMFRTCLP